FAIYVTSVTTFYPDFPMPAPQPRACHQFEVLIKGTRGSPIATKKSNEIFHFSAQEMGDRSFSGQRQRHRMQYDPDQSADQRAVDAYILQILAHIQFEFVRDGFRVPFADDAVDDAGNGFTIGNDHIDNQLA